jgi:hypothetical protein
MGAWPYLSSFWEKVDWPKAETDEGAPRTPTQLLNRS